jgi:phage internal scaffolding protein
MSQYFRENGEFYVPEYNDGRTKQSFKESCDINRIMSRYAKSGTISHLERRGAEYGDFTDMPDLLEAANRLAKGNQIFEELPGEIKREFGQDPAAFFAFVNDPKNADELEKLLPQLAEPGNQRPVVNRGAGANSPMAAVEPPSEPQASVSTAPVVDTGADTPTPQSGSGEA